MSKGKHSTVSGLQLAVSEALSAGVLLNCWVWFLLKSYFLSGCLAGHEVILPFLKKPGLTGTCLVQKPVGSVTSCVPFVKSPTACAARLTDCTHVEAEMEDSDQRMCHIRDCRACCPTEEYIHTLYTHSEGY